MKLFIAFLCALLVEGSASAQQGAFNIAKQQAKNAAGSTSGGQPGAAPPATSPPASPQPNPALQATLRSIANLRAEFEKFEASPTNQQPLINDLTAAAQSTKAKPASITALAGHLATALAGNVKLRPQKQKLAQNVHAIFNSSHLTAAQQQQMFDGVQKILTDGAVPPDDVTNVINGLKTIAAETK
jgi:hypothetical protein